MRILYMRIFYLLQDCIRNSIQWMGSCDRSYFVLFFIQQVK